MAKVLRVVALRLGEVQEITRFLQAMEGAYENLCAFDLIVDDAKTRYGDDFSWSRSRKSRAIRSIRKPETIVLPEDRLRLTRISVSSPGFWDFVGKLNPLEVLREYLADRHERTKDLSYRNDLEEDRLRLENAKLKTEVVHAQAQTLREFGVAEDKIREALVRHLVDPLTRLDVAQEQKLIGEATIVEETVDDLK